jgi:excisionase family DNA binding protein
MIETNTGTNKRAYSIKEVSAETTLSVPFVRLEIKRGNLQAGKFGKRVLITAENLSRYLNKGENENAK